MVANPCFLKNTLISTAHGKVPVNDLQIGDLVQSSNNKFHPVKFIGKRKLTKTEPKWLEEIEPIIIKQNAFGDRTPSRDLYVSPEHAFYLKGLFYTAKELVNERTIIRLGETPKNEIEYFHIDLGFHDLIFAEDAKTESFGGTTRKHFDNCGEFYELYSTDSKPYKPFAPFAYKYKRHIGKLGSFISERLPKTIHNLGKPLAHGIYESADKIEKRFSNSIKDI